MTLEAVENLVFRAIEQRNQIPERAAGLKAKISATRELDVGIASLSPGTEFEGRSIAVSCFV